MMRLRAVSCFGAMLMMGACTRNVPVKPAALGELETPSARRVPVSDGKGASAMVVVHTAKLERPDGSLIEVSDQAEIRVTYEGKVYAFERPLRVRSEEGVIRIAGGNRAEVAFELERIEGAEVVLYDMDKTIAGSTIAGVVLGVLAVVIIVP